jgi:hypothetical protein
MGACVRVGARPASVAGVDVRIEELGDGIAFRGSCRTCRRWRGRRVYRAGLVEGLCLAESEWGEVVWARLVREMARLEGGVEAEFGGGDGRVQWLLGSCVCYWRVRWRWYHVLALETPAVDARRERAGPVPRRREGVVAAFEPGRARAAVVGRGPLERVRGPARVFVVWSRDAELTMKLPRAGLSLSSAGMLRSRLGSQLEP